MPPDHFQLSTADIAIIVAGTLFVVIVGLLAARKVERTTEGYFLASGTMPWWLIGAAFVSTSVSSEQIVGTTGAAYKGGMAIANWERSEEHTSELQSLAYLVCRLLLEKKKKHRRYIKAR